jgi:hypothetical protein
MSPESSMPPLLLDHDTDPGAALLLRIEPGCADPLAALAGAPSPLEHPAPFLASQLTPPSNALSVGEGQRQFHPQEEI